MLGDPVRARAWRYLEVGPRQRRIACDALVHRPAGRPPRTRTHQRVARVAGAGALAGQLAGTGNINSVFGAVLPPAAALAAMLAYAIIPLAIAAITIERRDA